MHIRPMINVELYSWFACAKQRYEGELAILSPHWFDPGNIASSGVAELAISRSLRSEFNAVGESAGSKHVRSEFVSRSASWICGPIIPFWKSSHKPERVAWGITFCSETVASLTCSYHRVGCTHFIFSFANICFLNHSPAGRYEMYAMSLLEINSIPQSSFHLDPTLIKWRSTQWVQSPALSDITLGSLQGSSLKWHFSPRSD